MKLLSTLCLLGAAAITAPPAAAQHLVNAGAFITVQSGATLYVGAGGVSNGAGSTLANAGTVRVDGPFANPGTLNLSTGQLHARSSLLNTGTLLPGTSTLTFDGPANQLLTLGGATLYQVVVNKPTAGANILRLTDDLTISQQLVLTNGLVNTKSGGTVFTLHLPAGATLSGEAPGRYVQGALRITRAALSGMAAVDFGHGAALNPQGNNLGPVSITRTAGLGTADASYGANLDGTTKGIDRIWTVSPATQPAAGTPAQLTLSWLPDDDNGLSSFAQARGWQQTATGQPWTGVGPATDASARSITLNPTSLNRFTVSNAANPLPVTLLHFTARLQGPAAVHLTWATATELHNAGFAVERSSDGHRFRTVGTVPGTGTSSTQKTYSLLDAQLPAGATLLYYRLAQMDYSGFLNYSPVQAVRLGAHAASFVAYPTRVAAGQAAAYSYSGPPGPATLLVTDLLGRVVRAAAVGGQNLSGTTQGEVPLAGLPPGVYLLRYVTATASFGTRCVVE